MTVKFTVPARLKDIPLRDYIAYQKIVQANPDSQADEFVTMKMVSIFCGISFEDLKRIELSKYQIVIESLESVFNEKPTFKNIIKVNGVDFGFIPKLDDISLGEYVDIENYLSSPTTYHKAMAVLYRPITLKVKETYLIEPYEGADKYEDQFLDFNLDNTLAAMLFFWNLGKELLESMKDYLKEESATMNTESEPNSLNAGAGINQLTISQMETSLNLMKSQPQLFINVSPN